MKVRNKHKGKNGVFFIEDDHKEIGIIHYVLSEQGKMVIDHTEVNNAYEGKGFGRELIFAGVEYARKHQIKIIPLCPFAKSIFDNTPELANVLNK